MNYKLLFFHMNYSYLSLFDGGQTVRPAVHEQGADCVRRGRRPEVGHFGQRYMLIPTRKQVHDLNCNIDCGIK